jgi:hypothetical protein
MHSVVEMAHFKDIEMVIDCSPVRGVRHDTDDFAAKL